MIIIFYTYLMTYACVTSRVRLEKFQILDYDSSAHKSGVHLPSLVVSLVVATVPVNEDIVDDVGRLPRQQSVVARLEPGR